MTTTMHRVHEPPRSFFVVAVTVFAAGIGVGGFVLGAHYFERVVGLSTLVGGLAGGVAGQIETPWSRSQRTLMLIIAASLGVSLGSLGRFLF
jgi:hypothetical protein